MDIRHVPGRADTITIVTRYPMRSQRVLACSGLLMAFSGGAIAMATSPAQERRQGGSSAAAAAIANAVPAIADEPRRSITSKETAPGCKVAKLGSPFHADVEYGSAVVGFSKVFRIVGDSRYVYVSANKSGPVVVHWAIPFAHLRKRVTLNLVACDQVAMAADFHHAATRPPGNTNLPIRVRRVQFIWVTRAGKEFSHTVKDMYVIPKVPPPAPAP